MKNIIMMIVVIFTTIQVSAQDITQENIQQNNFYVDLVSKAATLNGSWGLFGGMRAGYNINKNVSLGAAGYGLIPDELGGSYINQDGRDTLHLGYGGLEASYTHNLSQKFNLTGTLLVGAGRVDYENMSGYDYFFISEPGVALDYNITDWFGLGYSLSYRFASGVKYADFSDASFSGWAMNLDFNFGF